MLRIYTRDDDLTGLDIIRDVEYAFAKLVVQGTTLDRLIMTAIDQGEYVDKVCFMDRLGLKYYISELSTDCKAALVVANYPDKVIDLIEVSSTARDKIICLLKDGAILTDMLDSTVNFPYCGGKKIDVQIGNYRFTNLRSLNHYLTSESTSNT